MSGLRNYATVTAAYWGLMVTDGALRMLVLLHFHQLGYSPLRLAVLFLLYEFMGIVTNLGGGWAAARFGLTTTLYAGLALQIGALVSLSFLDTSWPEAQSVAFVLCVQGVSGVAKDLTKMSSKTAIRLITPEGAHGVLFRWVALLTGSKNALKGLGFFIGGLLLTFVGFVGALWTMSGVLAVVLITAWMLLPTDMGRLGSKTKFSHVFSTSRAINLLSAARILLFGARDVWFVVGVPVFLYDVLGWSFTEVGSFLALWVIGYGFIQASAPKLVRASTDGQSTEIRAAKIWIFILAGMTAGIALCVQLGIQVGWTLILGLSAFGALFALNSSLHSYLVLAFSESKRAALNVGFYYMANAVGRLIGTLLSGLMYGVSGLHGCLWTAAGLLLIASFITLAFRPASAR